MKFKMLMLLLCGVITSSCVQAMDVDRDEILMQQHLRLGFDRNDQGARDFFNNMVDRSADQIWFSSLRFPLAVVANFLKVKNRKVGYLLSAFTNLVRLTGNTLSIRNSGLNKYNAFLTGYDLIRCGKDLVTAFSNDPVEADVQIGVISGARKILLPLVEASCAYCAALPIYPTKTQEFFQSISTCTQLLSDYLDSQSNSTESKLLLACLVVNVGCAGYDLTKMPAWWDELGRRIQEQENLLNPQVEQNNIHEEVWGRIEDEEGMIDRLRFQVGNQNNRPIQNTVSHPVPTLVNNGTIENDQECPICTENFRDPNVPENHGLALVTNCNGGVNHHIYHALCLNDLANNQRRKGANKSVTQV